MPSMPGRLYVEAPSMNKIMSVICETLYRQICPYCVPAEQVYSLVQYLEYPAALPPFNWVCLIHGGKFKGCLGVISHNCNRLIMPRHKVSLTETSILIPVKLEQVSLVEVSGLFKLTFASMHGIVKVVDPSVDAHFLDCTQTLIEMGHPDIFQAWRNIWVSTWPDGYAVNYLSTAGKSEHALLCHTDAADVALFKGSPIPLQMLSRMYRPGEELLVVFGEHRDLLVTVVHQPDAHTLLVMPVNSYRITASHMTIKPELNDFEDKVTLGPAMTEQEYSNPMTLSRTQNLLNHEAYICRGPIKDTYLCSRGECMLSLSVLQMAKRSVL